MNAKNEYRHFNTKNKKHKLISFRVPKDFPLNSVQVKMILDNLDIIDSDKDSSSMYINKVIDYYIKMDEKNKNDN